MELRKQKEIEHYDRAYPENIEAGDSERFSAFPSESDKFLRDFLSDKCRNKKILDYGCGSGTHSIWLADMGGDVTGIDLSKNSLKVAEEKVRGRKVKFLLMDCEKLEFPDNSFDIILDYGTFSSLDLNRALLEVNRVLKPDGFLIGIETLGHNPFTNFKREINRIRGKRTEWAARHIIKMKDIKEFERYFNRVEAHFFHIISWIMFPFLSLPGGKIMLKLGEFTDRVTLGFFPFFNKFSFKVVFILYGKKNI